MRTRFTLLGRAYLATAVAMAAAMLVATIRIYTYGDKSLPDTFSASVTNTAAVIGIAAFIGAIDMFFKFEETKERAEERRQWEARVDQFLEEARAQREEMRAEREETRAEREETRAEREEAKAERAEARAQREQNQQMFNALLEQNQTLTARLLDLLERRNGNGSTGAP